MAITTATLLKASAFSSGQFGVVPETGLTNTILQDIGFEASGKEITPATNEVGAEIGTGVMGGNIANLTGTYLYNGKTLNGSSNHGSPTDIGTALTFVDSFQLSGSIILVTFGAKQNHEGWETGDFKAINLDTATRSVTG